MKASLVISPVNASQAGFHKYTDPKTGKTVELDALLDDLGPSGIAEQKKFYSEWQQRFRKFDRASLTKEDNADWQLIDDQIAFSLLELDRIQSYKHNPTGYVEFIGNALFLPMSQNYAAADVRMGHVLARIGEIPRAVQQAKQVLVDTDPIYTSTALDENEGNIDLIEHTVKEQIPAGSALEKQYAQVAPPAIQALKDFSAWLQNDLAKRPTSRTWRLGKEFYDAKFKLVMETPVTPEEILQKAEQQMTAVRAEMLTLAEPMHKQMYPDHTDHSDLPARQRQNLIISEVLTKISDDHVQRDELMDHIKGDLAGIIQFIKEKQIVGLSDRDNLKVIATPLFLRGIYSVAGFHNPPPLEPTAEAQYWVTPIAKSATDKAAESKLREYNNYALKWLTIHEALPGHYVQFEHANNVQPETREIAAGAVRQWTVHRGMGRVHCTSHDGRRISAWRSEVQIGDAEDSTARPIERDSRYSYADDEHDGCRGHGPDDESGVPDTSRGGWETSTGEVKFGAAANVFCWDQRLATTQEGLPGEDGIELQPAGVPQQSTG